MERLENTAMAFWRGIRRTAAWLVDFAGDRETDWALRQHFREEREFSRDYEDFKREEGLK